MTRQRILYLIDGLGMGGAENLLYLYLQKLDTSRFEPRVCVLQVHHGNPLGTKIEQLGIPLDMVPVWRLRDVTAVFRLRRYFKQQQIDLVHTQLEFSNTLGNVASWLMNIPSVCTLHAASEPDKGNRTKGRMKLMGWSLRRFCDRVIAVSEETRLHHLRVNNTAPEKVITLYNGIDLAPFQVLEETQVRQLKQELGLPSAAQILITVAVLRPPKGIQFLIDALPAILAVKPDTYYLIVGDGEHRQKLEARAIAQGVTDRVIFTGFRDDIPQLLALSDIFVLPTLDDALPTVLAEAMAARKPVIASAVGGVPEMVEHSHNGLLLLPGDAAALAEACLQLLQDTDLAQQMGAAGREIVEERFNVPKQVHRLEMIYEELLEAYEQR